MARLGVLLNFVSHSVILGFSAGAAVLIGFKQIPSFLGLKTAPGSSFQGALLDMVLASAHGPSDHPGAGGAHHRGHHRGEKTAAVVAGNSRRHGDRRPWWPVSTWNALASPWSGRSPKACRLFTSPGWDGRPTAAAWSPVPWRSPCWGWSKLYRFPRPLPASTRQRLNINQEFLGQGISNLAAAFFSGYPGSGSFTRSAVNYRSGARTPMSGIVSGVAVAVTVLLAAPLAASLPVAALAGVLLVVAAEMIRFEDIRRTIRSTRNDAAVLAITFLSTLFLNIEFAVYVGVLLSIGLHMATTSHPRIYSTVPDFKTGQMAGAAHGRMCCQMDIVRIEGSIFFGSAAFVLEDLQRRLKSHPELSSILIRMHQVNNFDASGVQVLELIAEEVRARGGGLYFSGVNTRVFQVFKNSGLLKEVGETHFRSTTGSAIRQAMRESFCPFICAQCEIAVFVECRELKMGNWEVLGRGLRPRCGRKAIHPAS